MEFKIDTKDTFTVIIPQSGSINANLTGALLQKCEEMRQSGSKNYIIDLRNCTTIENDAIESLVGMHEELYSAEQSIVFTGISDSILEVLRKEEVHYIINIAPKMQEAIDIISMEILERDLLSEE